jgi:hypothetical protein
VPKFSCGNVVIAKEAVTEKYGVDLDPQPLEGVKTIKGIPEVSSNKIALLQLPR